MLFGRHRVQLDSMSCKIIFSNSQFYFHLFQVVSQFEYSKAGNLLLVSSVFASQWHKEREEEKARDDADDYDLHRLFHPTYTGS